MREIEKINHTGEVPVMEPQRQFYFMDLAKQYVTQISRKKGRPLTFHVTTFGCQMNARDSEKLCGILETVGFEETDSEEADFVIYNTCTVRENANNKVYGRLGYLSGFKKKNKDMMIALCGCMMQEPEVVEKLKQSYRFVDLVFGTHNIFKFAELLVRCFEEQKMVIDIWDDTKEIVEELPVERKYSFKSGVNIMFGCNNFCSYCIVPYVRGRERSRKPQDIIREIEKLVADGVVEVMLLGQNVNSYGKNLDTPVTFAQLLQEVEKIEGLERIRFMTSHPKDLSDELIEVMKNSKKICRHLHLPLQSGSSRVLKEMNRHYDKEHYLALVEKIKKAMPDLAITTDIIVGFPGETESAVSGGAQRLVYVHERPAEEDRFQLRNIVRETLFVLRYLLVGGCQVSDRTGQQHRRPGRDYRRGHCGYGRQHRTHGRGVEDEEARQYPRVYAFLQTESIPAPDSDRLSGHAHRQRVYRGIRAGLRPVGPELQGCLRGDRIVR